MSWHVTSMQQLRPHRRPNRTTLVSRNERGVTLLLVAVAMFTILAMAALAIDVVTLYVGRAEAQTAADAAAMAGAKFLVEAASQQIQTITAEFGR